MDSIILGNRIKTLMIIKNVKRKDLARLLEISYNSLTKKLHGKRDFTLKEIWNMQEIFELDIIGYSNILLNVSYSLV